MKKKTIKKNIKLINSTKTKSYVEQMNNELFTEESSNNMNYNVLQNVEVNVKVVIGTKVLSLNELSSLKNQDTIEFDNALANDPLKVYVNDILYAYGEVVIVDGNFGIQITHLMKDFNNE